MLGLMRMSVGVDGRDVSCDDGGDEVRLRPRPFFDRGASTREACVFWSVGWSRGIDYANELISGRIIRENTAVPELPVFAKRYLLIFAREGFDALIVSGSFVLVVLDS